jgi:chorismate dehydratase
MRSKEKKRIKVEGRKEGVPRVAASSYLNTVPLIWSFMYGTRRRDVDLVTDTAPARCADMLAGWEVEAALVPVIEYQRIPDLAVVPGVCVGSRSFVRSVVIVTRDGMKLEEVRSVAVDVSSRTSATLARVIFREFLGFEPEWKERAPDLDTMLQKNDAALIIGDPAMTFPRAGACVYDLADLWRRHTGSGFVFAMWMAREHDLEKVRAIDFAGARDEGLEHVDDIASLYRHAVGLPMDEIKTYLLENISFELDEEMSAGLNLFYALAHKHGMIPAVRPLKMIGR